MKLNITVSLCNIIIAIFASLVIAFTHNKTGAATNLRGTNIALLVISVVNIINVVIIPMIFKSKFELFVFELMSIMLPITFGIIGIIRAENYRKSLPKGTTIDATLVCGYSSASLALVCGIGMSVVYGKSYIKLLKK